MCGLYVGAAYIGSVWRSSKWRGAETTTERVLWDRSAETVCNARRTTDTDRLQPDSATHWQVSDNIYVYSPQEQTRTTEKIDRDRKKERKTYKLNVQYKHLNNNRDNKLGPNVVDAADDYYFNVHNGKCNFMRFSSFTFVLSAFSCKLILDAWCACISLHVVVQCPVGYYCTLETDKMPISLHWQD